MAIKKRASLKKSAPDKRRKTNRRATGKMPAFSHPMLIANIDDDGQTRTVWAGPKADLSVLSKHIVPGHTIVALDIVADSRRPKSRGKRKSD